jgi:GNAT superfamily N-acetyltransferase
MKNLSIESINLTRVPVMTLVRLRDLTNSVHRGDFRDSGGPPTSFLLDRIDRHVSGFFPFQETDRALVIRQEGQIVAWAFLSEAVFDKQGNLYEGPTVACHVYVHPRSRRHGLGTYLIQASLEAARESGASVLLAYPWSSRSHCFYQAQGFAVSSGIVPRWGDVVMSYDIEQECNLQKAVV